MTNYGKLEKSSGILVFAFDTPDCSYTTIAERTIRLAKKHLKMHATIVVNDPSYRTHNFDDVRVVGNWYRPNLKVNLRRTEFVAWNNFGRWNAYNLSPYETTYLLDADYCVFSPGLASAQDREFLCYKINNNVDGQAEALMGKYSLPHVWATAIRFRKTEFSRDVFNLMQQVEEHWEYYRNLYNIEGSKFRNDYALTIALNVLGGYEVSQHRMYTWPFMTISTPVVSLEIYNHSGKDDGYWHTVRTRTHALVVALTDLHIMDKDYLLSPDFEVLCQKHLQMN